MRSRTPARSPCSTARPAGTTATGSREFSQGAGGAGQGPLDRPVRVDTAFRADQFRYATLLIGSPYDTVTVANDGSLTVLPGGENGLTATGSAWLGEAGLTNGDTVLPAPSF